MYPLSQENSSRMSHGGFFPGKDVGMVPGDSGRWEVRPSVLLSWGSCPAGKVVVTAGQADIWDSPQLLKGILGLHVVTAGAELVRMMWMQSSSMGRKRNPDIQEASEVCGRVPWLSWRACV